VIPTCPHSTSCHLSFITGLVVGILTIQVFFHRFSKPLTADNMPESPTPPRKLMSYATQANPRLAWRKIVFGPYCSSGPSTCCSSKAYDQPPGHGSEGLAIQISP
jgi:hypothetical protein